MEAPTLKKVEEKGDGNAVCIPDLETLHPNVWAGNKKNKVATVICEPRWIDTGLPQEAGPR